MQSTHLAAVAVHGGPMAGRAAAVLMLGACLGGLVVTVIALFTEPPPDRRDGGEGDFGPGGGGGPGRGGPDHPRPGGGDPARWPEFDRQFAEYITSELPAGAQP